MVKHIYITSTEKQVLTTHTNLPRFCFLGTTPLLVAIVWANESPKVDNCSQGSNSRSEDCKAGALSHDHGHHIR